MRLRMQTTFCCETGNPLAEPSLHTTIHMDGEEWLRDPRDGKTTLETAKVLTEFANAVMDLTAKFRVKKNADGSYQLLPPET